MFVLFFGFPSTANFDVHPIFKQYVLNGANDQMIFYTSHAVFSKKAEHFVDGTERIGFGGATKRTNSQSGCGFFA